jgi:hypothetical protein
MAIVARYSIIPGHCESRSVIFRHALIGYLRSAYRSIHGVRHVVKDVHDLGPRVAAKAMCWSIPWVHSQRNP